MLLLLASSKWKLERGKAYDVTLIAGSRSVQAKAMAENKSVTIALADRPLNERVRRASILEVRGEGATLRVPLNGSTTALERMETCFEKNSRAGGESNPFVASSRKVTPASAAPSLCARPSTTTGREFQKARQETSDRRIYGITSQRLSWPPVRTLIRRNLRNAWSKLSIRFWGSLLARLASASR